MQKYIVTIILAAVLLLTACGASNTTELTPTVAAIGLTPYPIPTAPPGIIQTAVAGRHATQTAIAATPTATATPSSLPANR